MTPLVAYLYARAAILFVFGAAWAFAEYWDWLDEAAARRFGKRALIVFGIVSALWLGGSVLLAMKRGAVVSAVKAQVVGRLATAQFFSHDAWLYQRAERWVDELSIWSGRQLTAWALAGASLALLASLRTRRRTAVTYALAAVVAAEVAMVAREWVTVSPRPQCSMLADNADLDRLKALAGNERVFIATDPGHRWFAPPNTLASYGIATLQGYESIWPRSMWGERRYSTSADALSALAVRYAMVPVGAGDCWQPAGGTCWPLAMSGAGFGVYRNPNAAPRYSAGGRALEPLSETFNRRTVRVPAGAGSMRVVENWHSEWRYRVDGSAWRPVVRGSDRGMILPLEVVDRERTVEMEFRPAWVW
jgi:hypothetical protein